VVHTGAAAGGALARDVEERARTRTTLKRAGARVPTTGERAGADEGRIGTNGRVVTGGAGAQP